MYPILAGAVGEPPPPVDCPGLGTCATCSDNYAVNSPGCDMTGVITIARWLPCQWSYSGGGSTLDLFCHAAYEPDRWYLIAVNSYADECSWTKAISTCPAGDYARSINDCSGCPDPITVYAV